MDNIKANLDVMIVKLLEEIESTDIGSDERAKAIAELERFHKLRIEETKAYKEDKYAFWESIEKWANVGVNLGLGVLGIIAYNYWLNKGLEFESNGGFVTSPMTKNLLSKLLPKK